MTKPLVMKSLRLAAAVVASVMAASLAPDTACAQGGATGGIQVQTQGSIRYVSGGVGKDQIARMKAMAPEYNLHVVTATPDGAYVGSAHLTIAHPRDGEVLSTEMNGPLLYAQLPQGRYVVTAQSGSHVRRQTVDVGKGTSSKVVLTLATAETPVTGERARAEDQGVSLYDLDPNAVNRAKAEVQTYEVYPDGTRRALGPNEVPNATRNGMSEATNVQVAPIRPSVDVPANPGVAPAPAPGAPPY